ncbi:MAG TPA: YbaK/EbsC family protein [Anaerolineae bacterium]|nr:YbaK/EbsC family protein [Anaerolineae bacterium]
MTNLPPAAQALGQLNINYQLFTHPGPVTSLAQAATERNQQPHQIIRSLLFRAGDDYIMVLAAGDDQIDWKKLRHYLGLSRITMAKPDELLTITGYQRGAVTPLGLPQPLRLIADQRVFQPDEISIGSGQRGTTIILTTTDLRAALPTIEITDLL